MVGKTKRGATTRGLWPGALFENFHEAPSGTESELELWCYSDKLSYHPGETLGLRVSTTAAAWRLEISRDGAAPETLLTRDGLPGQYQATPADCSAVGCGWPVAFELTLPADWRPGGYLVKATAEDARGRIEAHHFFVLRPAVRRSKASGRLLLVAATSTWIAYNDWGGSNHYEGITGPDGELYSPRLSTQRPFSRGFFWQPAGAPRIPLQTPPPAGAAPRYPHMEWAYANGFSKKYASAGWASYERHFVAWAEAEGYEVEVATLHDLHFDPALLEDCPCVVFVGHDEYWSRPMRAAVDAYVEAGGKVARFAGNFLWQVRLEDEGATQVCYKYRARAEDPLYGGGERHLTTTCWDTPEVGWPSAQTFGLNALRGMYAGWGACTPRASGGYTVYRPEHWAFDGSDLYYGDVFGARDKVFGYEVDGLEYGFKDGLPFSTGADGEPEGLEILAMAPAVLGESDHGNPGSTLFIGDLELDFAAESLYGEATAETRERCRRGSGMIVSFPKGKGEVFHAGTCNWVAGLSGRDPNVERITRNVLDKFLGR